MSTFKNIPLTDFALPNERLEFSQNVNHILETLKKKPFIISPLGSNSHKSEINGAEADVFMPEDTSVLFSKTRNCDIPTCDQVVSNLQNYFQTWSETSVDHRAEILEKVAQIMTSRRHALSATMVLEVGKPWAEADADVAEAIDFCNYYAQQARNLFAVKKMGSLQGETNLYFFEPRGTTLVICPWNFPLAIPCGMFAASIVCGNCTILKPAEQSPVIASKLFEIFLEAGLPKEAAAFIPGQGETIGDHLSKDPRISTIVFTGSKEVGLKLIETGGKTDKKQTHVKKVIAEMGGKNAIIIDSDADIDEAVKGALSSAFGFQGQKCSACSRIFVVSKETFDIFTHRIKEAVQDLQIGPSSLASTFAGPVIDAEAKAKIESYIKFGESNFELLARGKLDSDIANRGHFIAPAIFINLPDDCKLMTEEIFGPVLAINQVSTFKEGIEKALTSEYRLTGGVFSRSPANIEYAMKNFKVGNLYINRGCTGALVFRQPFGGAFMSGVGSKAGGPDYLLQFVIPRSITENTMRRGFAPQS